MSILLLIFVQSCQSDYSEYRTFDDRSNETYNPHVKSEQNTSHYIYCIVDVRIPQAIYSRDFYENIILWDTVRYVSEIKEPYPIMSRNETHLRFKDMYLSEIRKKLESNDQLARINVSSSYSPERLRKIRSEILSSSVSKHRTYVEASETREETMALTY